MTLTLCAHDMSDRFQLKVFVRNKLQQYFIFYDLFHLAIISVLVIAIYWQVYNFKFLIGWDDQWFILNHYTKDGFNARNLKAILKDFYYGQYAPVNQLYYTALYSFFKFEPKYYHLSSIVLHLINASMVYYLLKNICKQLSSLSVLKCSQVAFISSLLFATSPVNIEPVAWVAASKVIIYTLFYLISINCYCKYISSKMPVYYYLTMLFFIISFGAKEQAVLLPICLLLIDFIYRRSFTKDLVWYEKLPFFVLSVFFGIVTLQSQGDGVLENTHFYPLQERIILAFLTGSEYVTKTILPVKLSFLYPFPFQVGSPMPNWLWFYPIATVIIAGCFYHLFSKKWLFFGIAFFVIHIILVVNLLSLARFSIIADRYSYLSTIGIYFILAYAAVNLLYNSKFKTPTLFIGVFYISYFIVYSYHHCPVWTNVKTLKHEIKNVIERRVDYKEWKQKKINENQEK